MIVSQIKHENKYYLDYLNQNVPGNKVDGSRWLSDNDLALEKI